MTLHSISFSSRLLLYGFSGLLIFSYLLISPVRAEESAETARKLSEAGEILPLEKILRAAKIHKNGKALETELELRKGRYIYEVEILDAHSQVWEIKLDAKSGKLIKLERDD